MVEMIASMETYLRRGRRTCQRLLLNPKIRTGGVVLLCGGSGFLLSAASLGNYPQPLAMGLILAMSGWHAAVMSLGAMLGYWVFWGIAGLQGLVWSASGGLLALLLARHIPEEQPLIFPAISAFLTALTGLLFQLVLRDTVPVPVYFLRIVLAAGAGLLFPVALRRRGSRRDRFCGRCSPPGFPPPTPCAPSTAFSPSGAVPGRSRWTWRNSISTPATPRYTSGVPPPAGCFAGAARKK